MNPGGIREYLSLYKTFSEQITTVLKSVVTDDANKVTMTTAQEMLQNIMELVPR